MTHATGKLSGRARSPSFELLGRDHSGENLKVSLVIPVFNEEEAVTVFIDQVDEIFRPHPQLDLELLFVNDGSLDATLDRLVERQQDDPRIRIVDLSRNFGKEAALSAGLAIASGQVVVPMDVDLQDPPELVLTMIGKWRDGYDVVLARRIDRGSDAWSKRTSAKWFYRVHNMIAKPSIPENVGDFRLMDRMVIDVLMDFPESRRFMKGLFAWLGFKTTCVDYVRAPRVVGQSKWDGWKLWNLAIEGITSFSTVPLRIWSYIGFIIAAGAIAYGSIVATRALIYGIEVPGYASIFFAVSILSGVQLLGIGILGEYIGRIYMEAKRRPVYLIRQVIEPKRAIEASE
ncbi:MAG: glycosyltransferase [Chromatiaceae bacterium]|nr:MAG: glycosyltransferase [Chromatiaceae bacterium]